MILEKLYGEFQFRNDSFSLESTYHTKGVRTNNKIPRDALTKTKYIKIISQGDSTETIKNNKRTAIIWEDNKGTFKGILITLNPKTNKITIITTYLFASKHPDKVLNKADQRIFIGKLK